MKVRILVGAVALGCTLGIVSQRVMSGVEPGAPQPSPAEQAAGMAEWAKIAAPGEGHKHLEYFVGTWETTTKMWMGGPGSTPVSSPGTAEIDWIVGGRFLLERLQGTMMGQYFESVSLTGYDNYRNLYERTVVSTTGTNMLTMRGMRHPQSGLITFYGEMDEPSLKVVGRTVKYVVRILNEKKFFFTTIDLHAADDYRVLQVEYKRQ